MEGCIELAWICGLIRPHNGTGVKGFDPRQYYVGWVDAATGEAVADDEVKKRYEKTLLEHSGIRVIEPELFEGYDPNHKTLYHQVAIDKKMAPLEVSSRQEAIDYRKELGNENVDIYQVSEGRRHPFLLLHFVLRFPSVEKRDHLPRQTRDKRAQGTLTR